MVAKALTVIPLLVLSGLFFAAEIVEGGVLFLAFAAVMVWVYVRARTGSSLSPGEMQEIELHGGSRRHGPGSAGG